MPASTAAGVHFVIAPPAVSYACELADATFQVDSVCEGSPCPVIPHDHVWRVPQGIGLGVTLQSAHSRAASTGQ
jgi:hypothetical protein